jgi:hypothetical protein
MILSLGFLSPMTFHLLKNGNQDQRPILVKQEVLRVAGQEILKVLRQVLLLQPHPLWVGEELLLQLHPLWVGEELLLHHHKEEEDLHHHHLVKATCTLLRGDE